MAIENLLTVENLHNAKWVYHYMMMFSGIVGIICGLGLLVYGLTSRRLHRLGTSGYMARGGVWEILFGVALLVGGILLGRTC